MVANELTSYNTTNISFLATKNSGLVAIIATQREDQYQLFTHILCSSSKPY